MTERVPDAERNDAVIELPATASRRGGMSWRNGEWQAVARELPEETAVAFSYDRVGFAVMMATPADLGDFALGFSLSEGIVAAPEEIEELRIVSVAAGIECRMSLAPARRDLLEARRRRIAGPVGCGLCGLDTLEQANHPVPPVTAGTRFAAAAIAEGFQRMAARQTLNRRTHAAHAAGFLRPDGVMLLREDVGRHNALDKLVGAAISAGETPGAGAVLITSRVSLDLIQKTARFGAPLLAAISVPTARAVREAEAAGLTLIGVARRDGFEVFCGVERVVF